jgi:hypothetical protein
MRGVESVGCFDESTLDERIRFLREWMARR